MIPDVFFAGAWEMFKGPLIFLAVPAIPLLVICLVLIAVMTVRESRKK